MSEEEFIKFIESIGFEYNEQYDIYKYKKYHGGDHLDYQIYTIEFINDKYNCWDGSEWIGRYEYNDLKLIQECFKHELRSIKLKKLLL